MTIVDLSKAFDTVNREALWKVLGTCGCPLKFVKVLRCFRDGMQALINFAGDLSEPFPVENGVKQGDLAAAVLFATYFAAVLQVALPNETDGIQIRYRTDKLEGNVFKLAGLSKSNIPSISAILLRSRLRWAGHPARLGDERLPKQMFYGEMTRGKRARHNPKPRLKDCLETSLKQTNIGIDNWKDSAEDGASWRNLIYDGANRFESKPVHHVNVKGQRGREPLMTLIWLKNHYYPALCAVLTLLARSELKSHERSHTSQPATDHSDDVSLVCQVCQKSCRSLGGLKRRFNSMHKELPVTQMSHSKGHICNICGFLSKSSSGLKSHLRAHYRNRAQRAGGASRQSC
jgi:hypothetical protein